MKKITYIFIFAVLLIGGAATFFGQSGENAEVASTVAEINNDIEIMEKEKTLSGTEATAMLANGCFWCVEADLEKVEGVISVVSGYAGGSTTTPTYENYQSGGHREVVLVTYDPAVVSYGNLVEHIIKHGDPSDAAGSFYDRGEAYAPAIYYSSEEEKRVASEVIAKANATGVFAEPLPLKLLPRTPFYPAEDYHQDYYKKHNLKYSYYRNASGRTKFIEDKWGGDLKNFTLSKKPEAVAVPKEVSEKIMDQTFTPTSWVGFIKPDEKTLRAELSPIAYSVTQEEGTERAGTSPYDKNYEPGIYVDVVSGEPLFSSRDKYDSGTGWPSFVAPISKEAVTEHIDNRLFSTRT